MDDKTKTSVTILGLGLMGEALADAFLRAGRPTTVWNRTTAKAERLVGKGARLAPTTADAVSPDSLAIVCLTDYRAVYDVLGAPGVDLQDVTVVNLTSGDSAQAREAQKWAEQRGARYLDGAIMAIPSAIGTAEAVILQSGAESDFAAHASTLEPLGTVSYVGADPGLAALYDVAGLSMMWSVLNAWLHGTALLRTAGVDAVTYATFAQQLATGVATWLPGYAEQIDQRAYPATVSTLQTDVRAMSHLVEESEAVGVNAELPRLIKAMADRAIAAGHGAEQYPVLIEEFSKPRVD